jgi:predicted pyridoxine 5'-phosphate oxidase superfamily flavin-nucleotide-binding protein
MNESQKAFGKPKDGPKNKVRSWMVPWVVEFVQHSPFLVMSTSDKNGACDASPRGGSPGFVKVLNETTLIIPDVAGNKLFQSYENLESNPRVGLIFFIPSINATARINGRVEILRKDDQDFDSQVLEVFSADENAKLLQAMRVTVEQSYSHCPRALGFSKLWDIKTLEKNELTPPISKWKPGT